MISFDIESTSLQIHTNSTVGSGDMLWVQFAKLNAGKNPPGIRVSLQTFPRPPL